MNFDYIVFVAYKIFKLIATNTPKVITKIFLDTLVWLFYLFDIKHNKIALANLDLVYNNKLSNKRKKQIVKNAYENLVYNLFEFLENSTLTLEELEKKITLQKST
jgi:KDO2-lipid IV(A) lauroyltransferase